MDFIISIATNPYAYLIPLGVIVAMYCAWALARRQYLSVYKLFNLVALSLATGWIIAGISQSVVSGMSFTHLGTESLWIHPRPIIVLLGYTGIALITARYIRAIRYPYWRTIDMVSAALSVFMTMLLVGWLAQHLSLETAVVCLATVILSGLVLWSSIKMERHGIATAIHIIMVCTIVGATRVAIPAWQETTTIVEWIAVGIGIAIGLGIFLIRISTRSEQVLLQDIPRGVSQSFYETFSRAFKDKQLPKNEG